MEETKKLDEKERQKKLEDYGYLWRLANRDEIMRLSQKGIIVDGKVK